MKLSRITRAGSAVAIGALALALAACGSDDNTAGGTGNTPATTAGGSPAAALSGELNGIGSSAQGAAQDAWRSGFQGANSGVTVNYDPQGSGAGRTAFISGAAQFAGSDAYMKDDEITQAKATCTGDVVEIPVYISPIAVAFNLSGVTSLNLDPATIANIFNGKITTWNDPAIAATNPGVTLPSTKITPVHRSDDSGTTQNFTDYLAQTAKDAWPYPAAQTFPVQGGQAAKGTAGVVQTITAGQGTIGYADESQVGSLGVAKLKVGDSWVAPTADGAAATVDASTQVAGRAATDLAFDLNRTSTDPSTYPATLVSYVIGCTTYSDASKAALVKGYFDYVISDAAQQAAASAAGSAPISDALRTKAQAAVDAIQG